MTMATTVKKIDVILLAASLLGNDRDNVHPEYSRAISELVNELVTGDGSADDAQTTEEMLWTIAVVQ